MGGRGGGLLEEDDVAVLVGDVVEGEELSGDVAEGAFGVDRFGGVGVGVWEWLGVVVVAVGSEGVEEGRSAGAGAVAEGLVVGGVEREGVEVVRDELVGVGGEGSGVAAGAFEGDGGAGEVGVEGGGGEELFGGACEVDVGVEDGVAGVLVDHAVPLGLEVGGPGAFEEGRDGGVGERGGAVEGGEVFLGVGDAEGADGDGEEVEDVGDWASALRGGVDGSEEVRGGGAPRAAVGGELAREEALELDALSASVG